MADVFVSYASDDRQRVSTLISTLEAQGLSVWWDRKIDVGTEFDKEIETAVADAHCIIVAWSASSIQSNWVRAEAADGLERGMLVQVLFDDVRPPLLFRQFQACSLLDWPSPNPPELERLLKSIQSVLTTGSPTDAPQAVPRVSILLADIENQTDAEIYSGSIDEALRVCLDEVSGVYVYPRDQAIQIIEGGALTIERAIPIGAREGLDFVVGGTIRGGAAEFEIELDIRPIADLEKASLHSVHFGGQEDVARVIFDLAGVLENSVLQREESSLYLRESVTVANLEALRSYNLAQRFAAEESFEKAIVEYRQAVAHDPGMGRAHGGWAVAAHGVGRLSEAREQWRLALRSLDSMKEQERLSTLGVYYALGGENHQKAAETFTELVRIDPLDARALNNLSVAKFLLLDFDGAFDASRRSLEVFPDCVLYRGNLALYSMYASDFETACAEAEKVLDVNPTFGLAYVPRAISALINNDGAQATQMYGLMAQLDARAASIAITGAADMAMASGRFADATDLLTHGVEADVKHANERAQAAKRLMLAECHSESGAVEPALKELREAMELGLDPARLATAASLLIDSGDLNAAREIGENLCSRLDRASRSYGRIVESECLAMENRYGDAADSITAALQIADLWYGHLLLSRVLLSAGHAFEAVEEVDTALRRRGEATARYLDDVPTFRFVQQARQLKVQATEQL
jgi:tetratricopeptide (TPR) repeat protein